MARARSLSDLRRAASRALDAWIASPDKKRAAWFSAMESLLARSAKSSQATYLKDVIWSGKSFFWHFRETGRELSLSSAIELLSTATKDGGSDSVEMHDALSSALLERYRLHRDEHDLADARRHGEQALENERTGTIKREVLLENLAVVVLDDYLAHRVPDDLTRALSLFDAAERLATDPDIKLNLLSNRAAAHRVRYEDRGRQLDYLRRSLRDYKAAIALGPTGRERFRIAFQFVEVLLEEARLTGETGALSDAVALLIDLRGQAVVRRDAAACHLYVAEAALTSYEVDRRSEDFDRTLHEISTLRLGFSDLIETDTELDAETWRVQAAIYSASYDFRGRYPDLETAIACLLRVVELIPEKDQRSGRLRNRLANALIKRFLLVGGRPHLDTAIDLYRAAANERDARARSVVFNNLGNALRMKFDVSGDRADLDEAIASYRTSLEQSIPVVDRARFLSNLAAALKQTVTFGEIKALDEAIAVYGKALELTRDSPSERVHIEAALIGALGMRWELRHRKADLDRVGPLIEELLASERRPLVEASGGMIDLALALLGLNRTANDRSTARNLLLAEIERLSRARDTADATGQLGFQERLNQRVAPFATALALNAEPTSPAPNTDADLAETLVLAESTRSMILSHQVRFVEVPAPAEIPAELLERERTALAALRTADRIDSLGQLADHVAGVAEQDRRVMQLSDRIVALGQLGEIWREMASFGDDSARYASYRSGRSVNWNDLVSMAGADTNGAVALATLYLDGARAHLFVVRPQWTRPGWVWAPLGGDELVALRRRFVREVPGDPWGTRAQTWPGPLQDLFAQARPWIEGAETVVFSIPGELWSLPLSVVAEGAGWRQAEHPLAMVVVPTLNLVPRFGRPSRSSTQAPLVVGNPTLDLAYADDEAAMIAEQLKTKPLVRADATRAATLDRLDNARIVHIAAHGMHVEKDPLGSGLVLYDGVLTAREIMARKISADLVVMSACESGLLEEITGEELVGLGQAFLIAGARTVLMSLWRVDDGSTADLMGLFYESYSTTGRAADALTHASDVLRSRTGHQHPYFWAPFVVMGDWRGSVRSKGGAA